MSRKAAFINNLIVSAVAETELMDTSDEENENILDELEDDLSVVYLCRYSYQSKVPKSYGFYDSVFFNLDDARFKRFVRCSRQHFSIILDKIKDHPVFHGKNCEKQFSPFFQLAVVMYRLGSNGNAASIGKISGLFGIGDGGTIDRLTARVFESIIALESEYLKWPLEEERMRLIHVTWDELPHCIGYTDGTEIILEEAPSKDSESYFSRTKKYSIKLQGTCDYTLKLRHILTGFPGSVHDARIFNSCDLAVSPEKYFSGEHWAAADCAYRLTRHVLTPFRRNNSSTMSSEQKKNFNKYFSSYRVRIEHCFGILKELLPSLKGLRLRIYNKKSHEFACKWIRVCCIIYNILLPFIEMSDFDYTINEEKNDDINFTVAETDKVGQAKRAALVEIILG
ncbi:Protein ANTAGONIST OF LIKE HETEROCHROMATIN PROTEIN 1 [Pseudolycoriella hygida]|uniref:Protein ANTAGONIST OF LIKE HETEROCHROMATIN PROTEIN 1 n=1 Tax=Pseudolycoriella hygida TaxID=35572 RepID=A0A9Q0N992_9DIPT|nr:Protein ANTAGONIST OF LIKE HETEROCHROMATIN PROTEIN 1 [Pseudolycoriella hygida]